MFGQWWTLLPTVTGMLVSLVLPTVFWVRMRVRSFAISIAVAPAMTYALVTILSIVFDAGTIEWDRSKVFPILGLIGVLGAIFWLFDSARRASGGTLPRGGLVAALGPRLPLGEMQWRVRISTWTMIVLGSFLAALPMFLHADPRLPAQQWDSTFHLNGVWEILRGHSATPFGGLSALYGGRRVFYPTTWHAFVALFSTPTTVITASNASSIVLMIVWVIGATALTSVVTTRRAAILAAPVLAGLLLDMPADNLTMYNQWPNAMGLAGVPGVVALAVIVGRRVRADVEAGSRRLSTHLPLAACFLLGVVGVTAAHPSSLFVIVVFFLPPILGTLWAAGRRALANGRESVAIGAGAFALIALALPFVALMTKKIREMGTYPRPGVSWSYAVTHAFWPAPPFTYTNSLRMLTITQAALLMTGVLVVLHVNKVVNLVEVSEDDEEGDADVRTRTLDTPAGEGLALGRDAQWSPLWPIATYLVFCLLTFLAYAPIGQVRNFLLAPWYMDARRIMGAHGLAMVGLMAIGFDQICALVHKGITDLLEWGGVHVERARSLVGARWRSDAIVGLILVLVTGIGALDTRLIATDYVYDPDNLGKPGMATWGEIGMLRRMQLRIRADAVVVGDPIAGAAYTQVIGQHDAVFPQLSMPGGEDRGQVLLARHFNEIHTNPQVCAAVHSLGVTYYYEDEDDWYYDFRRSSRYPGLYNVDTSHGFELIDEGGSAKLWKITTCGLGD